MTELTETVHQIVTDPPDPDCPKCAGTGVRGGCRERGCPPNSHHAHTMRFCECVNERHGEVTK